MLSKNEITTYNSIKSKLKTIIADAKDKIEAENARHYSDIYNLVEQLLPEEKYRISDITDNIISICNMDDDPDNIKFDISYYGKSLTICTNNNLDNINLNDEDKLNYLTTLSNILSNKDVLNEIEAEFKKHCENSSKLNAEYNELTMLYN